VSGVSEVSGRRRTRVDRRRRAGTRPSLGVISTPTAAASQLPGAVYTTVTTDVGGVGGVAVTIREVVRVSVERMHTAPKSLQSSTSDTTASAAASAATALLFPTPLCVCFLLVEVGVAVLVQLVWLLFFGE
jgi:hypothetical protein